MVPYNEFYYFPISTTTYVSSVGVHRPVFCLLRVRISRLSNPRLRRRNPRQRFLASAQCPSIHGSAAFHAARALASVATHRLPSHALPTACPRLPHALPHRADSDGRSPQSLHPLAQLDLAASPTTRAPMRAPMEGRPNPRTRSCSFTDTHRRVISFSSTGPGGEEAARRETPEETRKRLEELDALLEGLVEPKMRPPTPPPPPANMPLTKHLRVAIIDSNPALESRSYLGKNSIPDSRVSTVTPATISFFEGMILNQLCASSYLISVVFQLSMVFGFMFELVCSGVISSSRDDSKYGCLHCCREHINS
ncbi:uncharacterized protein [Zea mays]|uniref:uncharacterized protein n=1 Tax=Zea mays TaxID=4577 RepID=UPI0009A98257|nr:uncharacterized protein LOC103648954 [Zea mays]XP_035821241.1 uncharacterized protein LOC103648954 [Zea mays]|eukprot:XP_020404003.1 uncharacterized protein LOC103648954 isoform X1 [Zea mays]